MRVLFLTHNYPRFKGDQAGTFIEELALALPDDCKVLVLCPHAKGLRIKEKRGKVTIYRFRYAAERKETLAYEGKMLASLRQGIKGIIELFIFTFSFVKSIRKLIVSENIDIVHAHWLMPAGIAARLALSSWHIPLLLSVHGTDVMLLKNLIFGRALSRWVLSRIRLLMPVSRFLGDTLEKISGVKKQKELLPMPASKNFLARPKRRLAKRIVAIGNLVKQKRFDVLIDALGVLAEVGIKLDLAIVGDGPERKSLEDLCLEKNINTIFVGRQPHHKIPEILKDAGILVLPSVDEGFGLALVEGQLAGLAVIGADAGGQRDIIEDGKTGILVKPDDVHSLAKAIADLLSDERKTLKMAALGQANAKRFLAGYAATRLSDIYKRVLS